MLAHPSYGLIAPRRTLKHTVVDSSNFTDHQGLILLFGLYSPHWSNEEMPVEDIS